MSALRELVLRSLRCAHQYQQNTEKSGETFCIECGLSWKTALDAASAAREALAKAVESELKDAYKDGLLSAATAVGDDDFAVTFQTMGQYRSAMIKHLRHCAGETEESKHATQEP